MNILFFTAHPAQVHNFRGLKNELELKGHKIHWIATNKDISCYLLDYYGINYNLVKKPGKSIISKTIILLRNTKYCLHFIRNHNIDIIISRVSPYAALAGFLSGIPHIALADTESSGIYNNIFSKFVSALLTPCSFKKELRSDQIRFDGNIELFYLHPNRFSPVSKSEVSEWLGISPNDPYIIMRFVAWDAHHDKGLTGYSHENKIRAAEELSKYAKVYISSEKELPEELIQYKINTAPERIHDVLANASLFLGESATMASECAVLGTPAVFLDKIGRGYTDEEGQYDLVYNFCNSPEEQLKSIIKGVNLLKDPCLKERMNKNRKEFLHNKIDVTCFMLWFIEDWPDSYNIMKENPEYQNKFM